MKKILALVLLTMMLLVISGCNGKDQEKGVKEEPKITIGIVQIVEHPSLNTIREACVEQLAVKGFSGNNPVTRDECAGRNTIDRQNCLNETGDLVLENDIGT